MKHRSLHLVLASFFLTVPGTAFAEGTADIESLLSESVITTASTSAQKASTAPATSVTLTSEELKLYGIRSLAEAINFLSVGVITQDPLRTPDIGARGVLLPNDNGKHFLLLLNGHAINDPLYGAARFDQGAGIPIDLIDHIEVIVGPGSVLYGSNAMLGVINVITKEVSAYRGGHTFAEFEPDRSVRAGAGAGFTVPLFHQKMEVTAGAEYFNRFGPDLEFDKQSTPLNTGTNGFIRFRRNGPSDGIWGGTVRNAYFVEAPSGALRLRMGDFEVNVLASAYRRGIPYSDGVTNVDFDDAESYELDRALRLDLKHQANLSSLVQLSSRVYADSFDYQRRANRDALYGCYRSDFQTCQDYDAGLSRWAGIEERVSLNWLTDQSLVTLLGVDARMRWVSAKMDPLDLDTGRLYAPSVGRIHDSAPLVSPYVQQTWSPTSFLDVNGGARLDVDPRFSPIVSPRGAVAWSPARKTTFKAIYSQAFRTPTWNETDSATYHQARAPKLRPETARSLEATAEQRFGPHRVMFGVFRTWWDNLVEARALSLNEKYELQNSGDLPITASGIVRYQNVASIENYGWNGGMQGSFAAGRFTYGVNATEAFTRRKSGSVSEELVAAPQFFGNARLAYAFGGLVPTPSLAAYYVGQRAADRAFVNGYIPPPYAPAFAEFRATLSGLFPGVKGLGYSVTGTYVTASDSAYIAGPGPQRTQDALRLPVTFVPMDSYRIFFGIRYDFAGGEQAAATGGQ